MDNRKKSNVSEYIQKYKNYDSDYWTSALGNSEILLMLLKYTTSSWENLRDEIPNWDLDDVEILANALSDDENWCYESDITKILSQRSFLFTHIFLTTDINLAFDLFDRIEFVFKGEQKDSRILEKVSQRIDKIKIHPSISTFFTKDRIDAIEKVLSEKIKACS
jgi:hypothetical protein